MTLQTRKQNLRASRREFIAKFKKVTDGMKAGMYIGMDAISQEMETAVKVTHSADGWWNEPVGRSPGDLEATITGFVVPGLGDQKYLKRPGRNVNANWDERTMEAGMDILDRLEQKHAVTMWQMENRHVKAPENPEEPLVPAVVRAMVSSPIRYEQFQENPDVPYAHPAIEKAMEAIQGEVIPALKTSMSEGLRLAGV